MFGAQTLSPYLMLGSKRIFLVSLIVEGQEWVAGLSYRVSGGLSGQCCHWIIIGSAVLVTTETSHGLVVTISSPPPWLCWPLPLIPLAMLSLPYPAGVSLSHAGTSVFPALLDQQTSEPPKNVFFLLSLFRAPAWSSSPSPQASPSWPGNPA